MLGIYIMIYGYRCNHEMLKSALECLEAMVGGDNPEHFFVATQDTSLRRKFRQVNNFWLSLIYKFLPTCIIVVYPISVVAGIKFYSDLQILFGNPV